MPRLPKLALGLTTAAALAGGCGEDPTSPPGAVLPPAETPPSLGLNEEDRSRLHGVLIFAGEHSVRALQRGGAERVAAAFSELARRVEADDRTGVERRLALAQQAVNQYRDLAGDAAAAADLEAMDLTLELVSLASAPPASANSAAKSDQRVTTTFPPESQP